MLENAFWQVRNSDIYLVSLKEDRRFANLGLRVYRHKASHETPPIPLKDPNLLISEETLRLPPEVAVVLPSDAKFVMLEVTLLTASGEQWTGAGGKYVGIHAGIPMPPEDFPLRDVTSVRVTYRLWPADQALLDLRNMMFVRSQPLEVDVETVESFKQPGYAEPVPATIVTFTPANQQSRTGFGDFGTPGF